MKHSMLYYLIAVFVFLVIGAVAYSCVLQDTISIKIKAQKPFDIERMVDTLRTVESWDGHSRGIASERGPWQCTKALWGQFSERSFLLADSKFQSAKDEQRIVARKYVIWIMTRLNEARYDINAYNIALVWCAGWSSFYHKEPHAPSVFKKDYAQRASNIYHQK